MLPLPARRCPGKTDTCGESTAMEGEERGRSELPEYQQYHSKSFTRRLTSTSEGEKIESWQSSSTCHTFKNIYIKYISLSDPSQKLILGRNKENIIAKVCCHHTKAGT